MYTVLVVVQVLTAIALIALILLQHGKGADAGAAFGSGASGTVFGSRGASNFLSTATAWLATVFFSVSLALAYLVHGQVVPKSVVDTVQQQTVTTTSDNPEALVPTPVQAEQPPDQGPKVPE